MPRTVLLPLDPTTPARWPLALAQAQDLLHAGGVLHVLNVLPDYGFGAMGAMVSAALEQTALPQLRQGLRLWLSQNLPAATSFEPHVRTGDAGAVIVALAAELRADVIVLGAAPEGPLGAVALAVLDAARSSVFVVRG